MGMLEALPAAEDATAALKAAGGAVRRVQRQLARAVRLRASRRAGACARAWAREARVTLGISLAAMLCLYEKLLLLLYVVLEITLSHDGFQYIR